MNHEQLVGWHRPRPVAFVGSHSLWRNLTRNGELWPARARRGEPTLSFISSAAKCFASDVAMEVTTNAVQLFGGAGYTVDFPVERMMRDAKTTQIYEGKIQRVVMARALLA